MSEEIHDMIQLFKTSNVDSDILEILAKLNEENESLWQEVRTLRRSIREGHNIYE